MFPLRTISNQNKLKIPSIHIAYTKLIHLPDINSANHAFNKDHSRGHQPTMISLTHVTSLMGSGTVVGIRHVICLCTLEQLAHITSIDCRKMTPRGISHRK